MAVAEEAAELEAGEPGSEEVDEGSAGEGEVDFVGEAGLGGGEGFEAVVVDPAAEGTGFLDIGEEAVFLVFGVAGEPAGFEGSEGEFEFDGGAGQEGA